MSYLFVSDMQPWASGGPNLFTFSSCACREQKKSESAAEAVLDMQDKQPQLVRPVEPTWPRRIAELKMNRKTIQGLSRPHYGIFAKKTPYPTQR